jgi:flagellar basal-body rod protein FlgF
MDTPGYVALSRLTAQRRATDVLATNIANADTPGFKASQALFAEHMARQSRVAGPSSARDVAFAVDRATWRDFTTGPMQQTGNPLDLALASEGFFAVETPQGERFTRAGRFTLSPDNRVVDAEGNAVLLEGGNPLALPPGDVRIEILGDGTVRTESGAQGRLRVVRFEDPQRLLAQGDRLLAAPPEMQPEPAERASVVQGSVEGSNVKPVVELTRLTAEMREFQFVAQFVEREGERLQTAVDRILRRRS